MSHPKLEAVRQRYQHRCGYCGITEIDAGGELTIDHYRPVSAAGGDNDENLVYACIRCNQYKHNFWPGEDDVAKGWYILHPGDDDLTLHLIENQQTGHLEALTETGRFHIALLRLNRPQLVEHRVVRQLENLLQEKLKLQEQQLVELRKTIDAQEAYIAMLKDQLAGLQ